MTTEDLVLLFYIILFLIMALTFWHLACRINPESNPEMSPELIEMVCQTFLLVYYFIHIGTPRLQNKNWNIKNFHTASSLQRQIRYFFQLNVILMHVCT